jgi:hypothetical protein
MIQLNKLFYLCGIALCTFTLSSCGGDDEGASGGKNDSSKKIVSSYWDDDGYKRKEYYSYDSQGRVIEKICIKETYNIRYTVNYTYSDTRIVKECSEGADESPATYYLSNGRIVMAIRDESTSTYDYDNNGYLSLYSFKYNDEEDFIKKETFTWTNGDLVEISGTRTHPTTTINEKVTYTNIPWNKGVFASGNDVMDFANDVLFCTGYYGNIPKHLPSSIEYGTNERYKEYYEYTMVEGYVGTMKYKLVKSNEETSTATLKFTWQ